MFLPGDQPPAIAAVTSGLPEFTDVPIARLQSIAMVHHLLQSTVHVLLRLPQAIVPSRHVRMVRLFARDSPPVTTGSIITADKTNKLF